MPSFTQVVEQKRLSFAATVLAHVRDRKVFRVMQEEEIAEGEWWKTLEGDMRKYGIGSKEELRNLKLLNRLKISLNEQIQKQDEDESKQADVLPL